MGEDSSAPRRALYDAEDRRDRYWAGPVMPRRERAFNRRVSEACLRLMAERGTANISFTDLAAATGDISSRTLRRDFPSVAAAAYPTTWWLPGATDGVRIVLAPREVSRPCWPPDLDDPEVAAATLIEPGDEHFAWPPADFFESRGVPDPSVLARVFDAPLGAARVWAHGYVAVPEAAAPTEVAAHLTALVQTVTTGVTVARGPGDPAAAAFRNISLPAREPEPTPARTRFA